MQTLGCVNCTEVANRRCAGISIAEVIDFHVLLLSQQQTPFVEWASLNFGGPKQKREPGIERTRALVRATHKYATLVYNAKNDVKARDIWVWK
eukprot:3198078-Amphidinium_carterae.1